MKLTLSTTELRETLNASGTRRRNRTQCPRITVEQLEERLFLANSALVSDINMVPSGSSPGEFVSVNETLFFAATGANLGRELWRSDGTTGGTALVKDIFPGSGGSSPTNLTDVNGVLYFVAEDGTNGRELWKSDGTEAGTVLVKDIFPGDSDSTPGFLTAVRGSLMFAADDGIRGPELWRLDTGTEVKDLEPPTVRDSFDVRRDSRKRITQIVLTFSEPLDESRNPADPNNYILKQGSRRISLASVVYDPVGLTVTLTPQTPIAWKKRAKVTVTVLGAGTIVDREGNQLDGDRNGTPGGDFVRRLSLGEVLPAQQTGVAAAVDEVLASGEFGIARNRVTPSEMMSLVLQ